MCIENLRALTIQVIVDFHATPGGYGSCSFHGRSTAVFGLNACGHSPKVLRLHVTQTSRLVWFLFMFVFVPLRKSSTNSIELAHGLHLEVIAEGIETVEQLD